MPEPTPILSDESWQRREAVLHRFEAAWRGGQQPRIEDYLTDGCDAGLCVELIQLDWEYRRFNDSTVTFADYLARFPQYANDLQKKLNDTSESAALPGISGYEVFEEIGRGGMGVVYRARQTAIGRIVALKLLRTTAEPSAAELIRLRLEATAIGRLDHPNIVQIYDLGETHGRPYLAMEFVNGSNLNERLKTGPLPHHDAARIIETLARAIHHAHTRGIVHRDLTPSNILLQITEPGRLQSAIPKITDFGLAKILASGGGETTQTGSILGTPNYMAPEQAKGHVGLVGPCTDVYGLGAVLFAALTGRPPFRSDSTWETTRQVIEDAPPSLSKFTSDMPRDLETICHKCLAKEPHRRYASAQDLADDLRRFLDRRPIVARRVGPFERLRLWARRNPLIATTVCVAVTCMLLTAVIGLSQVVQERNRFRTERDRAEANLFRSLLTEARAQIKARDSGWWWAAMESLRRAAALDVPHRDDAELRDLVVECVSTEYPCFRLLNNWQGHEKKITTVALSPDGKRAVTVSDDLSMRVWSIPDGRCLHAVDNQTSSVCTIAFANNSHFASGSLDGSLCVWKLDDGCTMLRQLAVNAGAINSVVYCHDSAQWAAGCEDGTVYLIDANAEHAPRRIAQEGGRVISLAFQPGRNALAISVPGQPVRFRDLTTGAEHDQLRFGNHPKSLNFDTGGIVMTACDPESFGMSLFQTQPKMTPVHYNHLHSNSVVHVAHVSHIDHDNCYYWLTASLDASIRLWSTGVRGLRELAVGRGEFGPIRAAAVGGEQPWVVAGHQDGQVRVWELVVPPQRSIPSLSLTPSTVFLGTSHRLVQSPYVHDLSLSPRPGLTLIPGADTGHGKTWGVASSGDNQWFAIGGHDGTIHIHDAHSLAHHRAIKGHSDLVWSAAFSPDAKLLATGSIEIRIWDTADWRKKHSFDVGGHLVRALAFHPSGRWVVASVRDGTIRAWDVVTGKPMGEPLQMGAEAYALTFRPDGKRLAAACFDQIVRVWNLPEGDWRAAAPQWKLDGHRTEVWAAAYSPDGRWLATGSEDGVILRDADSHTRLVTLRGVEGQTRSLAFSADGELLAAASYYRPSVVWRLSQIRRALAELNLDWPDRPPVP